MVLLYGKLWNHVNFLKWKKYFTLGLQKIVLTTPPISAKLLKENSTFFMTIYNQVMVVLQNLKCGMVFVS